MAITPDSMVPPALVWADFEPAAPPLPRGLRRRLARARRSGATGGDALGLVAGLLGIERPAAGPLARLADAGSVDGRVWYRAEPVALVPDGDRLRVVALADDALDEDEAEALAAAAREHFGDRDFELERRGATRWYAAVGGGDAMPTAFPGDASGAAETRMLARLMNELQMLWYAHPVNEARRYARRPQAGGLRLWGGGRIGAAPALAQSRRLTGNAPEIAGLARWCELEWSALAAPEGNGDAPGRIVVVAAGEEAAGRQWLERLAHARSGFELVVRGERIAVPPKWRIPGRRLLR